MRYMLLIYGPEMAPSNAAPMPDMEPWNAYTQWMIDTGIYRAGDPLAPSTDATTVRVQDGRRLTTDGPFAETKDVAGGFNMVACASIDEAITWANKLAARDGDAIEVRPVEGCWWIYHE